MTVAAGPQTLIEALVEAMERAASFNKNDQCAPAAVLWTDKDCQWQSLIPRLRDRLPLFTLGPYDRATQTGPVIWLRCIVGRTLAEHRLPDDVVPVLYLPGVSRAELRSVEDCPKQLQPLVELEFRGVLWTHRNGRDWTISSFLQSEDGLGLDVGTDGATREALLRSLTRLADEPVEQLRYEAPIRADFLDGLFHPDPVRAVLRWLENPERYRAERDADEWTAFRELCRATYGFDPERDGPITAARRLGERKGNWEAVWQRFAETPRPYSHVPELLRRAGPSMTTPLFDWSESWPQDNEAAETSLRDRLDSLASDDAVAVRQSIAELEGEHGKRRRWVWTTLSMAPLASALEHLTQLAQCTSQPLAGADLGAVIERYVSDGWRADDAVLASLAAVETQADVAAVKGVIASIYRPWLETTATVFQETVQRAGYPHCPLPTPQAGTCLLFTDGLRFDAGQRLARALQTAGLASTIDRHLAALPTVTPTAKPAVSPAASLLAGGPELGTVVKVTGAKVDVNVLRRLLRDQGYQVLMGDETGDPAGLGWTECGEIDSYGHEHGWKIAHHLQGEIRVVAERAKALLDAGWQRVIVVTDHGWLLLPGNLPKAQLPQALTEVRKGRCARLKSFAHVDSQTVPWFWDQSVDIAVAPGIHCYEMGKEYEHGGLSPQECVVPVITVNRDVADTKRVTVQKVIWRGLRCRVTVGGDPAEATVDIRTKPADPSTSIAAEARPPNDEGIASLVVPDDSYEGTMAMVVILGPNGEILAQQPTQVGA